MNVPSIYNPVLKQGTAYLRLSAGRACERCRQQRVRCDLGKPCQNCVKANEECQHIEVPLACYHCSKSKIKCDKQRPCARCVTRGKPDECRGPEVEDREEWLEMQFPTVPVVPVHSRTDPQSLAPHSQFAPHPELFTPNHVLNIDHVDDHVQSGHGFSQSSAGGSGTKRRREPQSTMNPERPLKTSRCVIFNDTSRERMQTRLQLGHTVMRRMWDAGYSAHALLQLFDTLPAEVRTVLDQGLNAMDTLHAYELAAVGNAPPATVSPTRVWETTIRDVDEQDALRNCGQWVVTFDPLTSARLSLEMNKSLGERILGIHPEEIMARAGHSDLHLPHSELEFFCSAIDDVLHCQTPVIVRYLRVLQQRNGSATTAILIRRKARKIFNEMGQLVGVRNILVPVSNEEYDAALAMNPEACRPMLSAIGHVRSAQDLLEDVGRDVLIEDTFRELASSVEGINKISKLANLLRANFEPYVRMAQRVLSKAPHIPRPAIATAPPPPPPLPPTEDLAPLPSLPQLYTDGNEEPGHPEHPLPPSGLRNSPISFQAALANQRVVRSVKLRTDPLL